MTVELAFLSLTNYNKNDFTINLFPNPTSREANIQLSEIQQHIELKIYDSKGAFIEDKVFSNADLIHLELNYQTGVYFIHIFSDDFEGVLRLVKR